MASNIFEHWEYTTEHPGGVKIGETIVETKPIVLTDKRFRKYAAKQLGSAAAVGVIYKNASASANGDVQFAFMAWSKAQSFEKSEVETLASILVVNGVMTETQRLALIGVNWPEA